MNLSAENQSPSPAKPAELPSAQDLRRLRGYSLADLAETCGLTEHELARIEAGEEVALPYLSRVAAALRHPVEQIREYRRIMH